jgi:acetylglutamate kinase
VSRNKKPKEPLPRFGGPLPVRVYKVGGPALEDAALLAPLAAELRRQDGHVVLVHGGGRQIERTLAALGIESAFVGGRRATSPEAMAVVEMVLAGGTNKQLAGGLSACGLPAVGISGRDAGLVRAELVPGLGRVGVPISVHPDPILALWSAGLVPVIAPVSQGPDGAAVNVNADEAALAVAQALFAQSLVYLSDVDGVKVGGAAVAALDEAEIAARTADGTIAGGMAMKVGTALQAARAGIAEVVIAGRARLEGGFAGTRVVAVAAAEARA